MSNGRRLIPAAKSTSVETSLPCINITQGQAGAQSVEEERRNALFSPKSRSFQFEDSDPRDLFSFGEPVTPRRGRRGTTIDVGEMSRQASTPIMQRSPTSAMAGRRGSVTFANSTGQSDKRGRRATIVTVPRDSGDGIQESFRNFQLGEESRPSTGNKDDLLKMSEDDKAARRLEYSKRPETTGRVPKKSIKLVNSGQTVTAKELRHLRQYFDELDTDNSGTVDIDEISAHMQKMMMPRSSQSDLIRFPTSILGVIKKHIEQKEDLYFTDMIRIVYPKATRREATEMNALVIGKKPPPPKPVELDPDEVMDVEAMWRRWDKDGNGELDAQEFKDVLFELGVGHTNPLEIKQLYEQVDTDGSGLINLDEFKAWWFAD